MDTESVLTAERWNPRKIPEGIDVLHGISICFALSFNIVLNQPKKMKRNITHRVYYFCIPFRNRSATGNWQTAATRRLANLVLFDESVGARHGGAAAATDQQTLVA